MGLVQVVADEALAKALSKSLLLVTVMRQHSAKRGAGTPQPVPLGTAEVDLSPLLRPRCLPLTHRLALYKTLAVKEWTSL
jgi:hypothetical protein